MRKGYEASKNCDRKNVKYESTLCRQSFINIGMVHPNFALCVIVICKHYFVVFHKSKALSSGINMMSAQSVAIYCVEIEIGPILAVS